MNVLDLAMSTKILDRSKPDVFRFFYIRGYVLLHFSSDKPGTIVPDVMKNNSRVSLILSAKLTPKTVLNSKTITSAMLFKGDSFTCSVPWENVYAIIGEEGLGVFWDVVDDKVKLIVLESGLKVATPKLQLVPLGEPYSPASMEMELLAQDRRAEFKVIEGGKK